jgi:hypothetical protein
MATWLGELNVATPQRSEDPLVSGMKQLALRIGYAVLILFVTNVLLRHLTYFQGEAMAGWRNLLPALFFVLAFISLPASILLIAVIVGWAVLYESPAAAIWFVFMLLLLLGVFDDRREHALLLAATPGLLLLGFGFLPTFLIGLFYGAKRGLMNGFGCLLAVTIAAVIGLTAFPSGGSNADNGIVLTGFQSREPSLIGAGQRLDTPQGILDFKWIDLGRKEGGSFTLEGGTKEVANFAERWAMALGRSPVALALPLLWGLVAIVIYQSRQAGELILERVGISDWKNGLLSRGFALLVGSAVFFIGYVIVAPSALGGGFWGQLFWSALWATVVVLIVGLFRVLVEEPRSLPTWLPQLVALYQRFNPRTVQPTPPAE